MMEVSFHNGTQQKLRDRRRISLFTLSKLSCFYYSFGKSSESHSFPDDFKGG